MKSYVDIESHGKMQRRIAALHLSESAYIRSLILEDLDTPLQNQKDD